MSILVVDDEIECRDSLAELLSLSGYEVLKASSGEDALVILRSGGKGINLMLVDLMMPGMNGEELIRRAWQEGHRPKSLVVTAAAPWQTAGVTGLGIGYIRKPYDGKVLIGAIENILRKETPHGNQKTRGGNDTSVDRGPL